MISPWPFFAMAANQNLLLMVTDKNRFIKLYGLFTENINEKTCATAHFQADYSGI